MKCADSIGRLFSLSHVNISTSVKCFLFFPCPFHSRGCLALRRQPGSSASGQREPSCATPLCARWSITRWLPRLSGPASHCGRMRPGQKTSGGCRRGDHGPFVTPGDSDQTYRLNPTPPPPHTHTHTHTHTTHTTPRSCEQRVRRCLGLNISDNNKRGPAMG